MPAKPTLFIGSSKEGLKIADAIHSNLRNDIEVTVWRNNAFMPTKGTLEELSGFVNRYDFAVFVLSGDDVSTIRKKQTPIVRDNVVLEAGMFIGRLGRDRVFLFVPSELPGDEQLYLPTDLLGTTTLSYEANRQDENWEAATSPDCSKIRSIAKQLGGIRVSRGIVAYGDTVVLQDFNGAYVQVDTTNEGTLKAVSQTFGNWNSFEVVSATGAVPGRAVKFGDKIGLRSVSNRQFVSVDYNEDREKAVGAWVPELKAWETFVIKLPNPQRHNGDLIAYGTGFALLADENKSVGGKYIAVKHEDALRTFWAKSEEIGNWERLMFVEAE